MFRLTLIAAAVLLSGCAAPENILSNSKPVRQLAETTTRSMSQAPLEVNDKTPGSTAYSDALAIAKKPVARHATKAWHGARMQDVQSDEMLPPVFYETRSIAFDDKADHGRVSIGVVAERISRMTGVPVRVKSDVYGSGGFGIGANMQTLMPAGQPPQTNAPAAAPLPAGMLGQSPSAASSIPVQAIAAGDHGQSQPSGTFRQPVTDVNTVEMRWQGSMVSFLDHLTGRLNLSWSYREGVVVIERFVTETFELTAFGGTQDFKMALTGGNTGSGGSSSGPANSSNSTLDMTEAGKMQVLDSLKAAIESMVKGNGGSVVLNEGTGRFFVTAPRDVMARVREAVKAEDLSMQRQAQIQFDVYSVLSNDTDEAGVNWDVVYQGLATAWGATISSPASLTGSSAGSFGVNILARGDNPNRFGGTTAVLSLLNQLGSSATYRPISMVAMNRQWARKTNLKVDGFVSETTPATASSVGSGSPGLKTSSITTGDKFMVQPAIMDNGNILLKFGVSLTELLGLFDVTAGSGATLQKVQTPVTSGTDDQGTIRLQPGEVMVVTGLSRRLASSDRRTLTEGTPVGLGGSRKDGFKREDFLIVVRATQI